MNRQSLEVSHEDFTIADRQMRPRHPIADVSLAEQIKLFGLCFHHQQVTPFVERQNLSALRDEAPVRSPSTASLKIGVIAIAHSAPRD